MSHTSLLTPLSRIMSPVNCSAAYGPTSRRSPARPVCTVRCAPAVKKPAQVSVHLLRAARACSRVWQLKVWSRSRCAQSQRRRGDTVLMCRRNRFAFAERGCYERGRELDVWFGCTIFTPCNSRYSIYHPHHGSLDLCCPESPPGSWRA